MPEAPHGARLVSEAVAAAAESERDAADNVAIATLSVASTADLSVVLALDAAAAPGRLAAAQITVHNQGPSTAHRAAATLRLPEGMKAHAIPAACGHVPDGVACALGALAPGAEHRLALKLRPDADGLAGARTLTATVSAGNHDPRPANDASSASITVLPVVDLALSLTATAERTSDAAPPGVVLDDAVVTAGRALTLTLRASNASAHDATGVLVTGTLPAGVALAGADPGCSAGLGSSVVCRLGAVPAGTSAAAGRPVVRERHRRLRPRAPGCGLHAEPPGAGRIARAPGHRARGRRRARRAGPPRFAGHRRRAGPGPVEQRGWGPHRRHRPSGLTARRTDPHAAARPPNPDPAAANGPDRHRTRLELHRVPAESEPAVAF